MEKRRSRRSIFKCNGCEMRFSSSERHKCISHIRDKHCSESNTHDHGRTSISNIEPKENPLKREFNYLQSLLLDVNFEKIIQIANNLLGKSCNLQTSGMRILANEFVHFYTSASFFNSRGD